VYSPLSDVVTCPRCGPAFGLLLLADRVEDRRVYEASLGCANCRERFSVSRGYAALVEPGTAGADDGTEAGISAEVLAALLGVTEGPALLLLAGPVARHAAALADLIAGSEIIAAWSPLAGEAERAGVSRFATPAGVLPFRSGSMRAVALPDARLIAEAARVAAVRARVVVLSGEEDVAHALRQAGLRVLARDERATVAERSAF
jgi:hypothetical protein